MTGSAADSGTRAPDPGVIENVNSVHHRGGDFRRSAALALALASGVAYLVWLSSCLLGAVNYAWDDNFMTYIYSRNLSQGHGLRYNATDLEPVEGFSSLSHTVAIALTDRLGVDPLLASRAISLVFFLLIPVLVGLPLSGFLGVPVLTTITVAVASQILAFLTLATAFHMQAGMETIMFMGGLAGLAGWTLAEFTPAAVSSRLDVRRVVTGLLALGFVAVTRPEGPFLVALTLALVFVARRYLLPGLADLNDRSFSLVSAVSTAGILAYFCWKKLYFGYLLPNPYYMKANNAIFGSQGTFLPGWDPTRAFLALALPWLIAGFVLLLLVRGPRTTKTALLIAALPGAIMVTAYARTIHEAAIFYRYDYPYLVYVFLPIVGSASWLAARFRLLPLLLVPGVIVWVTFFSVSGRGITLRLRPTVWLSDSLETMSHAWVNAGKDLALTGLGQQATIAVSASGAIPFYSGFTAIDLSGLNNNFLSGRTPRSVAEIWAYIESHKPDVFQSVLPPASPGIGVDQHDPVFSRQAAFLDPASTTGEGVAKYWNKGKLRQMQRTEMVYLRDHYGFGGAYRMWPEWNWIILYVRRDSPFRERLFQTLRYSFRADLESDLRPAFGTDIRQR